MMSSCFLGRGMRQPLFQPPSVTRALAHPGIRNHVASSIPRRAPQLQIQVYTTHGHCFALGPWGQALAVGSMDLSWAARASALAMVSGGLKWAPTVYATLFLGSHKDQDISRLKAAACNGPAAPACPGR